MPPDFVEPATRRKQSRGCCRSSAATSLAGVQLVRRQIGTIAVPTPNRSLFWRSTSVVAGSTGAAKTPTLNLESSPGCFSFSTISLGIPDLAADPGVFCTLSDSTRVAMAANFVDRPVGAVSRATCLRENTHVDVTDRRAMSSTSEIDRRAAFPSQRFVGEHVGQAMASRQANSVPRGFLSHEVSDSTGYRHRVRAHPAAPRCRCGPGPVPAGQSTFHQPRLARPGEKQAQTAFTLGACRPAVARATPCGVTQPSKRLRGFFEAFGLNADLVQQLQHGALGKPPLRREVRAVPGGVIRVLLGQWRVRPIEQTTWT